MQKWGQKEMFLKIQFPSSKNRHSGVDYKGEAQKNVGYNKTIM